MRAWLALAASLIVGLLLGWQANRTPSPLPADAPPEMFSAERAFDDVSAIARAPHPTGSRENARVRDYLLARLGQLGLEIRIGGVQAAEFGEGGRRLNGAAVENVIAILPGRDRAAPALLIMSHYDSVPGSPGAADDASGVAAALEIARALRGSAPPARDVIFLFTDGEELGLFGARAFFERLPLARRVGFVINMEARGGGGRALMFETGRGNGDTIALFGRNAVRPSSNSLAVFVYENMPNSTDFTPAKALGLQGLNFAFIGRPAQYHSPGATPAALDRGALQHLGEQGLAAARAAATAERLPERASDAVYSDLLGAVLLAYPPALGWLLLALAAAAIGLALAQARRNGQTPWIDVVGGAGAGLFLLLVTAALLRLARRLTGVGYGYYDQYALLGRFGAYEIGLGLLCLAAALLLFAAAARASRRLWAAAPALALGVGFMIGGTDAVGLGLSAAAAVLAVAVFGRRAMAPWGLWIGLLLLGLVLATTLQIAAATTAFIVQWPLLLAAICAAVTSRLHRTGAALVVGVGFAGLALGQIGGWAHPVALGIGAALPEPLALFTLLGALCASPLLLAVAAGRAARWVGAAAGLAGLGLMLWLRMAGPSDMPAPQQRVAAAAAAPTAVGVRPPPPS